MTLQAFDQIKVLSGTAPRSPNYFLAHDRPLSRRCNGWESSRRRSLSIRVRLTCRISFDDACSCQDWLPSAKTCSLPWMLMSKTILHQGTLVSEVRDKIMQLSVVTLQHQSLAQGLCFVFNETQFKSKLNQELGINGYSPLTQKLLCQEDLVTRLEHWNYIIITARWASPHRKPNTC